MNKYKDYVWYFPVVIVLIGGYFVGGGLAFGIKFLNVLPDLKNETARLILLLFGMGILGATVYCTRYWADDIEECVYRNKGFLPHVFDFFGYATTIVGGGITGIISYLLVKTGLGVSSASLQINDLNLPASVIIAFCGGLFHFRIQDILSQLLKGVFGEKNKSTIEDSHSSTQNPEPTTTSEEPDEEK